MLNVAKASTLDPHDFSEPPIDTTKARVDMPLMLARNITVTNGIINLIYNAE
jgi:hypothetical protein